MNVYSYIAENNPNDANQICVKNGLDDADTTETLAFYLQTIVAQNGVDSLKEILNLHPDKEVILELYQEPTKIDDKNVFEVKATPLNADGQSSNIAQNTNTFILLGAIVVSLAIISLNK
jgi:hypothetical protein